jgi:hypothetical protein
LTCWCMRFSCQIVRRRLFDLYLNPLLSFLEVCLKSMRLVVSLAREDREYFALRNGHEKSFVSSSILCLPPNARVQLVDSSCGASCASREPIAETPTGMCVSRGNNGVISPIRTHVRSIGRDSLSLLVLAPCHLQRMWKGAWRIVFLGQ